MNESRIPAAEEQQPANPGQKRPALVQRLSRYLILGLIASVPVFFASIGMGRPGLIVFAVYFVPLTALALVIFLTALVTLDASVIFAAAFALAVIAAYWLARIFTGE